MTVVLSAFLAETQTAHDRNTFTSIGEESGRFGWRVQHLFLATVWKNQGGRESC